MCDSPLYAHIFHLTLPLAELFNNGTCSNFRALNIYILKRLFFFSIFFNKYYLRFSYLKLIPFAKHFFNQNREMQLTSSKYGKHGVRSLCIFQLQRNVGEQLSFQTRLNMASSR